MSKDITVVAQTGSGTKFFADVTDQTKLEPGVYRMMQTRYNGDIIPGFAPIKADNDPYTEVGDVSPKILKELKDFMARKETFERFGFSHKRGYLLHGPPGCGKSTTLRMLEDSFVRDFGGVVLTWSPDIAPEDHYATIRRNSNSPVMLVVEDLENTLHYFETRILEFLDGQTKLDNFVIVATTNYLDRIPPRLKNRPSRFDRLVEVPLPNEEDRAKYLRNLHVAEEHVAKLAKLTDKFSLAQVKEVVISTFALGNELEETLSRLRGTATDPKAFQGPATDGVEDSFDDNNQ